MSKINYEKYIEVAREKRWDWKNEKIIESNEIDFIWFDRKGLREFIKSIVESEKEKIER